MSLFLWGNINATETPMSLKQCIDYAMVNNLDIKQAALNIRSSIIDEQQSKNNLLPTLSASAGQHYQFGRTIDRFSNTFVNKTIRSNNVGLNAGITVFNGFQNQNTIKQNEALKNVAKENYEKTKNQVALNVASAYLQVIQSQELIKVAEFLVNNSKQNIERAQKMVDAGTTDLTNLLTQKAQLANEELNLVNAKNNLLTALTNLKFIMQMPLQEELSIVNPQIDINQENPYTIQDLYISAVSKQPQVLAAIQQNEAAAIQTKVAKGLFSPNISIYGSISTVFSENSKEITGARIIGSEVIGLTQSTNENVIRPTVEYQSKTINFSDQFKDNLGQSAGVSLSWNLFNGFQTHNQIQKAKINEDISQINLIRVQNTLMSEITLAFNNYQAALAKFKASQNSTIAQKQSLDYIQKRFDAGVSNSFELNQTKNNYNIAYSNEIQAKYDLVFRGLILSFYKNNTIEL